MHISGESSSNEDLDRDAVLEAKAREVKSWIENYLFIRVLRKRQKYITTRWNFLLKICGRIKVRLVARGFEDREKDLIPREAPTCKSSYLRLALFIISQHGGTPKILDLNTAFLQGMPL